MRKVAVPTTTERGAVWKRADGSAVANGSPRGG